MQKNYKFSFSLFYPTSIPLEQVDQFYCGHDRVIVPRPQMICVVCSMVVRSLWNILQLVLSKQDIMNPSWTVWMAINYNSLLKERRVRKEKRSQIIRYWAAVTLHDCKQSNTQPKKRGVTKQMGISNNSDNVWSSPPEVNFKKNQLNLKATR